MSFGTIGPAAPAIGVGLVLIALLFASEGAAAVDVWVHSTAYGHCFLVLPIALWLLWERRAVVTSWRPRVMFWPAIPAVLLAALWMLAYLLGVMEGRQLAAIGFVELLLLAVLGWRLWWGLSPGLLYLFFLVPFGAFFTPALQRFTAAFIVDGLDFLDIPYEADSFRIAIPEGVFYVAEACAGLRFLIASVAFGVLYAVSMFRSLGRRIAFIAISCVVPVLANGVRGLGIVLLGHALGSAQAGAADHIIYGWVFFSAVILLLAAAGLPFREDVLPSVAGTDSPPFPARLRESAASSPAAVGEEIGSRARLRAWAAGGLVVLAACLGPLAALVAGREDGGSLAFVQPALVAPPGCSPGGWHVAGDTGVQEFGCQEGVVRVESRTVSARLNPARVLDAARVPALSALGSDVDTGLLDMKGADPPAWVLMTDRETERVSAYVVWVDGMAALGSLRDRLRLARAMFAGWHAPSVTLVVSAPNLALLQAFLGVQKGLRSVMAQGGVAPGLPTPP